MLQQVWGGLKEQFYKSKLSLYTEFQGWLLVKRLQVTEPIQ